MTESNITYFKGQERQNALIDSIRTEIAQLLQSDNLSFLIGAGCSSHKLNDIEIGIPSMTEIYTSFLETFPDFELAGQKVSGHFNHNLEKMLEMMGAIQLANDISVVDEEIDEKIVTVRNFLRQLIVNKLNSREVKETYKSFYTKISQKPRKSPISIFTTNYDLFNEIALDELGFPYNNGFSGAYKRKFSPASYNYMYVENMNLNKDVWERVSSFFNLIKLHGSVSWVRKNDQIWEQDYESINDVDTVMIYPTPLKDRTTLMTPYSDLFRTMENRLVQKNSTLIVMGYSFSDDHINRVILNGLSVPTFRLIIFGKHENIDKLIEMGDSRIVVINSDDCIHYFKNIVDKVLPSVHPDIAENLHTLPINEIIEALKPEVSE